MDHTDGKSKDFRVSIKHISFVTKLSFVRAVKDKEQGVRVSLTWHDCREHDRCAKNLKMYRFTSRAITQRCCSLACRNFENDWRRIMTDALKLLLEKLLLMTPHLLLWVKIHHIITVMETMIPLKQVKNHEKTHQQDCPGDGEGKGKETLDPSSSLSFYWNSKQISDPPLCPLARFGLAS